MRFVLQNALMFFLGVAAVDAGGQFYKPHGASISVGATDPFTTPLTTNAVSGTYSVPTPSGGIINETISNQQQFTTSSVGFVTSLQLHPKPWAGVEFNYGYSRYSEIFTFNYSSTSVSQTTRVVTDAHEATGAYQFHPRYIPFQPFVNIGGGAIDFVPGTTFSQWRGAGLLEAGFDIPASKHIGFRIEGRSLFYRAPNFYSSAISTESWRATYEPSVSTYYRF